MKTFSGKYEHVHNLVHFHGNVGHLSGFVPASALTDIYYIARRATDIATARIAIKLCLAACTISPVDRQILAHATTLPGNDFEENVQIACAISTNLDAIVTRNPQDFAASPVAILTPAALLTQLSRA